MKHIKKSLGMLLALAMLLAFIPVFASADVVSSGPCGTSMNYSLDDGGILTITGSGAMTDYAAGGAPWYGKRSSIKYIIVESGPTTIGKYAFYNLPNLVSIGLPTSVKNVKEYGISNGPSLIFMCYAGTQGYQNITFATGNATSTFGWWSRCLAHGALNNDNFWTLDGNGELTIGGSGAMPNYGHGDPVTGYNSAPYAVFWERITKVTVGQNISYLGEGALSNLANMTSVIFSKNTSGGCALTSIGNYQFYKSGLISITIPDSVTTIGKWAFYDCGNLQTVKLPSSLTAIGEDMFAFDNALKSIVIPSGVESIGDKAFFSSGIKRISLPLSVKEIGVYAFNFFPLTDIYYEGTSAQRYDEITVADHNDRLESATWHYETKSGGVCGENLTWVLDLNNKLSITGSGAMSLTEGQYWKDYMADITEVTIGSGVTSIAANAFKDATAMTKVTIPSSVTSIGYSAFDNCPNVKAYISDLTAWCGISFGNYKANPLYNGNGLYQVIGRRILLFQTVEIPNTVTAINSYAFYGYTKIVSLTVPGSVQTIGYDAFCNCTNLKTVVLQEGVKTIEEDAFRASGVNDLTLPLSVTDIINGGFYDCASLATGVVHYAGTEADKANINIHQEYDADLLSATWECQPDVPAIAAPTGVKAKASGDKQITITWNAVEGATQYNVYRYRGSDKQYHYIGTTRTTDEHPTQYVDTGLNAGTNYHYKVVAAYKDATTTVVSEKSADASAKAIAAPAAPKNVTAKASGDKQITISWSKVTGATQYNVYRYNGTKKEYVYKGTTKATAEKPTEYVDSGLNAGTNYYYKVVAVIKDDNGTVVSAKSASAHAKAIKAPAAPTNVKAKASGDKAITVTWTAVAGATQYNVYRYNSTTQSYVYKGTTKSDAEKPTEYVDSGLTANTNYTYKVVAVIKDDNGTVVSAKSASATAKAINAPAAPNNVQATAQSGGKINITWNRVTVATQYNVYRYNGTTGDYKYIGTTKATDANPTTYVDTGRTVGTTYYYKVVAVIKNDNGTVVSAFSAAASAKAK